MTGNGLGVVFPGQGSQSVGMLADLASRYPTVADTFREGGEALGIDLWRLSQEGPEADLNRTEITQPAMLCADVAVWRVWREQGGEHPAMMAGHSLGEYAALVCSGAIGFRDAVSLVRDRGRFMQDAVADGEGAMAAVLGLDDDAVRAVCEAAASGQVCEAVNFNSPGQVVIAGHRAAVERAVEQATAAGARRAMTLPVSVPSHCALMKGAANRLRERLAGVAVQAPSVPVVHNVDCMQAQDADDIRRRLVAQLHNPVRWVDTILAMRDAGIGRLLELGPGKVLAGLNRRIDRDMPATAVTDSASLVKALG